MFAITVTPLVRSIIKAGDALTYYSSVPVGQGALVAVLYRQKLIYGIVLSCQPLASQKLILKKESAFQLKPIKGVISPLVFSDFQLELAQFIADYYYAPLGLCAKMLLPPFFLKRGYDLREIYFSPARLKENGVSLVPDSAFLEIAASKSKQYLGARKQVLVIAPEELQLTYFADQLKKFNPLIVRSKMSNKQLYDIWRELRAGKPKLVIGTRRALFLPLAKLGLICLFDESSFVYKSELTPKIHAEDIAAWLARRLGAEFIMSATLPRAETSFKHKAVSIYQQRAKIEIVDTRRAWFPGSGGVLANKTALFLSDALRENKKVLLFVPRRGYSTGIVCQSCGHTILCSNCEAPVVVHQDIAHRRVVCHHCLGLMSPPRQCPKCYSRSLKEYGLGIEKAASEVKKFAQKHDLPIKLSLESGDHIPQADANLIIATHKILARRLWLCFDLAIVLSLDAMALFPDYRINEGAMRVCLQLAAMSKLLIIQTREPNGEVAGNLAKGNMADFAASELDRRRKRSYPPFSRLTKLTYAGTSEAGTAAQAVKTAAILKHLAARVYPQTEVIGPLPAFISKERGRYRWHIILKTKQPNINARNELLGALPVGWSVDVDPLTIL